MAIAQIEVQKTTAESPASSKSITLGTATTAGELIIAVVAQPYAMTATVSDSASQSYTQVFLATFACGAGNANFYLFYKANSAAGVTSVTATSSGGTDNRGGLVVAHYTGVAASSPVDQYDEPRNVGASPWSSDSVTTTNAADLLVGACYGVIDTWGGTNGTPSASGLWTQDLFVGGATGGQESANFDGGNGGFLAFAHQIVSSTGSYANTGTTSSGTTTFKHYPGIVAFKAAVTGPAKAVLLAHYNRLRRS